MEILIKKALESLKTAKSNKAVNELVFEDKTGNDPLHEFLFFIKPEITILEDRTKLSSILDMTFGKISQHNLHIGEIRLLTASYLHKYDIMARHYGVINSMSREPLEHLSGEARSRFTEAYGKRPEEVKLLGSLQFLEQYPDFSAGTLEDLWKQGQSVKLAAGTYCARVRVNGEEVFLINGFHPNQLVHFTEEGRCILTFRLAGSLDWSVARNQFIGKTNPADAMPGSLRNELLVKKDQFGMPDVSAGRNGFHLSAGPVEGLVELMRYCSDFSTGDKKGPDDFVFGRQLRDNFTAEETDRICGNRPVNYKGNKITPFDLTEEKNSRAALDLLKDSQIL